MQKQLVKSTALATSITHELVDRIVRGVYPPNSWIPTEGQLETEFGVSRTVIRESIQMVVNKGMLRIDRGRGTIVEEQSEWRVLDPVVLSARLQYDERETILSELLTIRKGLEPELAAIACERLDDAALSMLNARINDLRSSVDRFEDYLVADAAFHRCITEIADVSLSSEIFKLLAMPLGIVRSITALVPGSVEHSMQDHLRIFQSIRARDPEGARKAVRSHLDWAADRQSVAEHTLKSEPRNSFGGSPD